MCFESLLVLILFKKKKKRPNISGIRVVKCLLDRFPITGLKLVYIKFSTRVHLVKKQKQTGNKPVADTVCAQLSWI